MVSLLRGMTPETMTLDVALQLLTLPHTLGQDPEGVDVQGFTGRYGPYIKRGSDTLSLGADFLPKGTCMRRRSWVFLFCVPSREFLPLDHRRGAQSSR